MLDCTQGKEDLLEKLTNSQLNFQTTVMREISGVIVRIYNMMVSHGERHRGGGGGVNPGHYFSLCEKLTFFPTLPYVLLGL